MIPLETVLVCIFAWQAGLVADVPLNEVHLYKRPVIVPCYWTFEKSRAFWWATAGQDIPEIPLPPATLQSPPKD